MSPSPHLFVVGLLFALPGCGAFDSLLGLGGDGGTPSANGFGAPALEVTASDGSGNRVQLGPQTPDPGSSVQLVDTLDGNGHIVRSQFSLNASVQSLGISCSFSAVRENPDGTTAIGTVPLQVVADNTGRTPDGTVSPASVESAVVPNSLLTCSGTSCNGAALAIRVLDSAHAEGSIVGTYQDSLGRGDAQVVCAFYLPMSVYQP